ncbi:MAG: AAA family ATPase [Pseudomonadota bacterium]
MAKALAATRLRLAETGVTPMQCSKCGGALSPDQKFCGACGQAVAKHCHACGSALPLSARFCTECGAPQPDVPAAPPKPSGLSKPTRERRQITVVFADIVGSVALLQSCGLEAYEQMVEEFRALCDRKAQALGGRVLKFLGDGVMMGFGYPQARENAPACAVEASLAIAEALQKGPIAFGGAILQARFGIETGLAMTGRVAEESQALLGEAPNMAARVQNFAESNGVAIGPTTARIVRDLFELIPLGSHEIRGKHQPMALYAVKGISAGPRSGLRAKEAGAAPAFVGRRQEMTLLGGLLQGAASGRGAAVLLVGDPGIGKSRAVAELVASLPPEAACITLQSLPQLQSSDLAPLAAVFRRQLADRDTEDPVADLVAEAVGEAAADPPLIEAFRQVFQLGDGEGLAVKVSAELRRRALEAAQAWFDRPTGEGPQVLVAEDLHWADEESLQFLKALTARHEGEKRLLIMTARPEFTCPWLARLKVHQLPIEGLDAGETRALIAAKLACQAVSPSLVAALHGHSGGVPLFIEELVASLLETDRLVIEDDKVSLIEGSVTGVPTTIMDLIMSRLERLGEARWLAQVAAVAGRQCPVSLLAAVTGRSHASLSTEIDSLLDSGLVSEQGHGEATVLEFKHALVQEAAYQTLPRDVRESYHLKIGEVLMSRSDAASDAHRIAAHFDSAGRPDLSFPQWMEAGGQAVRRSANEEALRHLRAALSAARLRQDLEEEAQAKAELSARLAMAAPAIAVHGWSAPAVEVQYREAERLARKVGDPQQSFDILRGKLNVYLLRGDLAPGLKTAKAIAELAEEAGTTTARIEALRSLAVCAFLGGDFEAAKSGLQEMRGLYSGAEHHTIAFRYGSNPFVVGESWRAWALCFTGEAAAAERVIEVAIEEALANDHSFSLCYALCFKASIQQCLDQAEAAEATARRIIELAHRQGYPYWVAWAEIVQGWALAKLGNPAQGQARCRDGLRAYAAVGARQMQTYGQTLLAETLSDRPKAQAALIARARLTMQRSGVTFYAPALERLNEALTAE